MKFFNKMKDRRGFWNTLADEKEVESEDEPAWPE